MALSSWLQTARDLIVGSGQRLTRRVALGVGVLTIAAGHTQGEPHVPVNPTPALVPEVEVRKLNGRYLLGRVRTGFQVFFAGHVSHSSHSSHRSHASHYSSAVAPTPSTPAPAPAPSFTTPATVPASKVPRTIFADPFTDFVASTKKWRSGVFLNPSLYDPQIPVRPRNGVLEIVPRAARKGHHFAGYVSRDAVDLEGGEFTVEVRDVPSVGGQAIVLLAEDATHYVALRADTTMVTLESYDGGSTSRKTIPYHPETHRHWRFRQSDSSNIYVWESSANDVDWRVLYAFPLNFRLDHVTIELSAGTHRAVNLPGRAAFGNVQVTK